MEINNQQYIEWLTTIASVRLVFNSMEELEDLLDNHAIHSNGIKRCFPSLHKLRSAFRDLKGEVNQITDDKVSLDKLLMMYKKTSDFFKAHHMGRRTFSQSDVTELLLYFYPPYERKKLNAKNKKIFKEAEDEQINPPLLFLMMLKILPNYEGKSGDIRNIEEQFDLVLDILDQYTKEGSLFQTLPALSLARQEEHKSRVTLIFHTTQILNIFESFEIPHEVYNTSSQMKESMLKLNIEGFWNECGGENGSTEFWEITPAINKGYYFALKWTKKGANQLYGTQYSIVLSEDANGKGIAYMIAPQAITKRINGENYSDEDNAWYQFSIPEKEFFNQIELNRILPSQKWWKKLELTRVTDSQLLSSYQNWLEKSCEIIREDEKHQYVFFPEIYAITHDAVFLPTQEEEGGYYKVPKNAASGLEHINLHDNAGIMTMNGERYIVFDDLLLFIHETEENLKKYGITKVNGVV
jgi:hypothetical protein